MRIGFAIVGALVLVGSAASVRAAPSCSVEALNAYIQANSVDKEADKEEVWA